MIEHFTKKMIHALRTESCFTYKIQKIGQKVVVRTISTPKKYAIFQQLMQFVLVNAILHFSDIPARTFKKSRSQLREKNPILGTRIGFSTCWNLERIRWAATFGFGQFWRRLSSGRHVWFSRAVFNCSIIPFLPIFFCKIYKKPLILFIYF